ncbi:MAG: hypothetical protein LBV50_06710, partial [Novosphingobium sp.]|nr:hypothetical protein [Novosphingobium sp.]
MPTSRFSRPQPCSFRPSADLAGRPVAILPDVPTCFDEPLAEHHKLIGRWVASRETSARRYARPEVRARIEQVFDTAVMEVLEPIDLADFTVAVLHSEEEGPPAIALVCRDMGQIDLGWIGADDVPVAWSAAAYTALELTLGRVLPAFTYAEFFEEFAVCHWEGETDDEAARQCLVDYHGMDPDDVDNLTLP